MSKIYVTWDNQVQSGTEEDLKSHIAYLEASGIKYKVLKKAPVVAKKGVEDE